MNDKQFDLLLQSSLPELPPEEIASKVNPWRRFVFYIIIGLILNSNIISVKYLSILLPTIGSVFLVLGFQALRNVNRYFKMGWIYSILHFVGMTILRMSPRRSYSTSDSSSIIILILLILAVMFYSLFRCFALGVNRIQEEWDVTQNYRLQRIILGCSSALVFFNIISSKTVWSGYLITIIYIILIICIIRLLKEMEQVGYSISVAPVLISNKMMIILTMILMAVGLVISDFMIPLEPENQTQWVAPNTPEVNEVKRYLISMGFPEQVLDSMGEKDILLCKDAKNVIITKSKNSSDNPDIPENYMAYDIAVELSDKERHWKLVHYFEWTDNEKFYSSDCLVLWPVERGYLDVWEIKSGYTGQILYQLDGVDYRTYFEELSVTSSYSPELGGYTADPEIIAEFTFPKKGTEKRGYISYDAVGEEGYILKVNSWIKYIHQTDRFLYPAQTAGQYWRNRYFDEGKKEDSFTMIETSVHYSTK